MSNLSNLPRIDQYLAAWLKENFKREPIDTPLNRTCESIALEVAQRNGWNDCIRMLLAVHAKQVKETK